MKNFTNVKSRTPAEIVIPELEEAVQNFHVRDWSAEEEAIMKRYYDKVPLSVLLPHLPGRTLGGLRAKAQHMGITRGKKGCK